MVDSWILRASCLITVATGGCASEDEPDDSSCWRKATSTPRGSIELGTGIYAYEPMPDAVDLVYGLQGGFHFDVRAHMRGLDPGDTIDVLSKRNPTTRYQAFYENGDPITPNLTPDGCGITLGYAPASAGDGFTFPPGELRFPDGVTSGIFDRQYRVVVEIIDAFGGYARDEKLVIAREPVGWDMQF